MYNNAGLLNTAQMGWPRGRALKLDQETFGHHMSIVFLSKKYEYLRNPTIWVPTRSDTNRPVQSQKQARSLKFQI